MKSNFHKTLNVLIVENSEVDRKMLIGMLTKAPYGSFELESSETLKGAFQLLESKLFDVILLDLNLNDSDGIETLEKINKGFPDVAIVVNTGAFQDDLGLTAVTKGAQDYLIKGMYKAYGLVKSLYYAIERKKAEQELKATLIDLKEAQGHLIRVEKMNIVGSIASGIAHEVKNPLATILYGIEYLDSTCQNKNEKIELTLKSMREATHKANNIIKDLLDFSSLSVLKKAAYNIEDVIGRALNLTYHQCEKHNIKVVKDFGKDVPLVYLDSNRIEQVIVDVVLNAIFAIHKDGVLTIRTKAKKFEKKDLSDRSNEFFNMIEEGEDVVIVDFDDTGSGISEEDIDRVFDPFFTTRRARGGVGLGLSITRTIMLNHSSFIELVNLPEGGARARLVFKVKG